MIIVSESSAESALSGRTSRCPPTRSRSSTAHNVTHRHANIRPISVHTEEVINQDQSLGPLAGLAPGWPRAGHEVVGTQGMGIPSRRHRRCSRSGVGVQLVQRVGCLQLDPDPRPAMRRARRRDGIPTSVPLSCSGPTPRACHSVPLRTVNQGHQRILVTGPTTIEAPDGAVSAAFQAGPVEPGSPDAARSRATTTDRTHKGHGLKRHNP
jgi:hypothetical protein